MSANPFRYKTKDVQVAINVAAAKHKGSLTPELLIKEAQPQDNPLHDQFVWDNNRGGHLYRLEQARRLLRSYGVKRPSGRMFFLLRPEEGGPKRYVRSQDVMKDPELRRKAAVEAYLHFKKALHSLEPFPEYFAGLLELIHTETSKLKIEEKPSSVAAQ